MSGGTIIVDTNTLSNLYYGGGTQAWDSLLKSYDNVVIPDRVVSEMTTQLNNPAYPKDDAFAQWLDEHQSEVSTPTTDVGKAVADGTLPSKNSGEQAIAEVAN